MPRQCLEPGLLFGTVGHPHQLEYSHLNVFSKTTIFKVILGPVKKKMSCPWTSISSLMDFIFDKKEYNTYIKCPFTLCTFVCAFPRMEEQWKCSYLYSVWPYLSMGIDYTIHICSGMYFHTWGGKWTWWIFFPPRIAEHSAAMRIAWTMPIGNNVHTLYVHLHMQTRILRIGITNAQKWYFSALCSVNGP